MASQGSFTNGDRKGYIAMRALSYALALTFVGAVATPAIAAPSPSDFVTDALKGDNSEIMLGNYAAEHGGTAATKKFGRTLVADHTKAKDQMAQVAEQLHVTPPSDGAPEAQSEMQKLQGMKGSDFDKEFASYMVDDHQKDISKFKEEADAKNGPASTVAAKQLPTLRKHLKMAQALEK